MIPDLNQVVLLWDPRDPEDLDLDPSAFRAMGVQTLGGSIFANRPEL